MSEKTHFEMHLGQLLLLRQAECHENEHAIEAICEALITSKEKLTKEQLEVIDRVRDEIFLCQILS